MTPGGRHPRIKGATAGGRMQVVIILVHLMIVLAMIGVVLLQKSEGGGLGIGSSGGFLSSRGTANVLTRTTAALAVIFFTTSLLLSILAGWDRKPRSIIQNTSAPTQQTPGRRSRAVACSTRCANRSSSRPRLHPDRRYRGHNEASARGPGDRPLHLRSYAAGEW